MDSEKIGVLNKGEEIVALEQRTNETGTVRVRFDRGWTSLATTSGLVVLRNKAHLRVQERGSDGVDVRLKAGFRCQGVWAGGGWIFDLEMSFEKIYDGDLQGFSVWKLQGVPEGDDRSKIGMTATELWRGRQGPSHP